MATDDQQFCLRWNNHQSTLISVFDTLLESGTLVDCTLAAEGQFLKAHKVVLSACSPYLELLLSQHYEKHPIVILKDVKFQELKSMMDYMYRGEVNISQDQLGTFLKAAESLQIKGLSDNGDNGDARDVGSTGLKKEPPPRKVPPVATPPIPQRNMQNNINRPAQNVPPRVLDVGSQSPSHGSREDSMSPSLRKRRRIRRNSQGSDIGSDSILDTTSNSCDLPSQAQSTPISAGVVPSIPATMTPLVPSISAQKSSLVIEQTLQTETLNRLDTSMNSLPPSESGLLKAKIEPPSEELLQPKTEYLEDINNDDSVEDLTLDDDDDMDASQMGDMSRPGPSHGGDGSNQGFAPWHLSGNQTGSDEVFMAAQEAVGAHRDSQDWSSNQEKTFANYCNYMYKGIGLYDHFIMGQDSEDYSPIKYEDCEGRIVNVASIKPRKTKFTPRSYYNCEFCGKWYRSKTSLGLHRRLECGKEPTFQCPYCPLKTHQKGNLQVHIKKKHLDQVLNESFNPNRSRTSDTFNESSSDFDDSILSPSEHKHHPNQGLHSMLMDSSSLLQTLGSKSVPPSAGQAKSKPVLVVPKSFSVHSVDKTNENNPLFPKAPEINQNLSVSFTDNYSKIISGPGQTKVNQKPMKVHDENNTKLLETAKKIEAINSFGSIRVEPVAQSQQKLKPTNSSNLNSAQTNSGVEKSVFVHKMGLLSVDSVTPKHHGIVKAVTVMPPVEKPQPQKSNISTKNSLISELLSSPQLTEKLVPCLPDNSKANNIPGNSTESEKPLQRNSTTCKIGVKDLKLLTNAESEPVSTSIKEKTEIKQTTE